MMKIFQVEDMILKITLNGVIYVVDAVNDSIEKETKVSEEDAKSIIEYIDDARIYGCEVEATINTIGRLFC